MGCVFTALIIAVGYFLFGVGADTPLFNDLQQVDVVTQDKGDLVIAYSQPLSTYEPMVSDRVTRQYLSNVYEGLARFDVNLKLEPALALSWGMVDDHLWQVKLRPEVRFHDDSTFNAEDVVASVERAKMHVSSQRQGLVEGIERVDVIDDFTLQFRTMYPDPLLMHKLTLLPMVPSGLANQISMPVGTGPYQFNSASGGEWMFDFFEDYWGGTPAYSNLIFKHLPDKVARYDAILNGEVDVLGEVPPIFVEPLLDQSIQVASLPSLEVNFLLFNREKDDSPFRHEAVRRAFTYLVDPVRIEKLTGGYGRSIGQFVSRGVFGYNPQIDPVIYDPNQARALLSDFADEIVIDFPEGLEALGSYFVSELAEIEVSATVNYWPVDQYDEHVLSGESDVFFFGWKSDLGDAAPFFSSLVHSEGALNAGIIKDVGLDDQIEQMDRNVLETIRTDQLQSLMRLVVEEEVIGLPLFESDTLVGVGPSLVWNPRIDNLILATDFR